MLVDIKQGRTDPGMDMIFRVIGGGNSGLIRIDRGMYLASHWSIEHIVPVKNRWKDNDGYAHLGDLPDSGVCDTPEQAVEKLKLREHPVPMFVTFVCVRRADQSPTGGWRWHKWGEYIGDHWPQHEYIYDERDIDQVYTFSIYQPQSAAILSDAA